MNLIPEAGTDTSKNNKVDSSLRPRISILIPAYNYPEGVSRILTGLGEDLHRTAEIIIGDDSAGRGVATVVTSFQGQFGQLHYHRNDPPLGACANWNDLLARATGDYCLLLHHDEFPVTPSFLDRLSAELIAQGLPEVLILSCIQVTRTDGRNILTAPQWARSLVSRRIPSYLFSRNIIGPSAVIVAKRPLYPAYDPNLTWMIDVDAYVRLFQSTAAIELTDIIQIASPLARKDSITSSLRSRICEISTRELCYLSKKYPNNNILTYLANRTCPAKFVRFLERVCWVVFRFTTRICYGLMPSPIAMSQMHSHLQSGLDKAQRE